MHRPATIDDDSAKQNKASPRYLLRRHHTAVQVRRCGREQFEQQRARLNGDSLRRGPLRSIRSLRSRQRHDTAFVPRRYLRPPFTTRYARNKPKSQFSSEKLTPLFRAAFPLAPIARARARGSDISLAIYSPRRFPADFPPSLRARDWKSRF